MRNTNHSSKKTICCISIAMALSAFGADSTALPPDPQNAALLYYQAFLLRHELDDATGEALRAALRGAEPDDKVRKYVKRCRRSIDLAEAAAKIPKCDWGIWYSQGITSPIPQFVEAHRLTRVLWADARTLAADGNYRAGLERCLTMRRFARHLGYDRLTLYVMSKAADKGAQKGIQQILGSMPPDAQTLTWLQEQLAADGAPRSLAKVLQIDFELLLHSLRKSPETLARVREKLLKAAEDPVAKKMIQGLTDEELVARARKPYADFLDSVLQAIDSDMPYQEKYSAIEDLTHRLEDEFRSDPAANEIIRISPTNLPELYSLEVSDKARFNALKAAIAIYIETAKAERLPETLPDGLPKDPYSDQDFEYEKTEEGFLLRSRLKPIDERDVRQYEFKVRRE